ncbi:glycosyltransferase [Microbacterium sp. Marseille-Q6965]|uniref:glycosyltransferase n=1 Tax=Microbacterium sp. Marseille-Q6965 TaxID=2965072 RepID=UPI0021B73AC1|nr:glycosyltransferase [Microbacterium sp. Marseille-Q6965]
MRQGSNVLVFPAWRENPYLNLLALAARSQGWHFLGATTYDSLRRQLGRLQPHDVLHLHWTQPLLQSAASALEAEERLGALRRDLEGLRSRGISIVWTVHNRLPHELSHRDAEISLYRTLGELADVVHIMAPATADVVSDVVTLDSRKLRVIPHPSYEGIYDMAAERSVARAAFELADTDRAVLFLGQIRPYKGVDALIAASRAATLPGREIVLMLAGAVKEMAQEEFTATLPDDLRTITHLSFVSDGELGQWFRAADVAVFPYRAILNSGSLHLAASFQTPVVLPNEAHLRSQFGSQRWVRFFDPARPTDSIAELLSDPALFTDVTAEDFAAFTDPISPWAISREYHALLEELSSRAIAS